MSKPAKEGRFVGKVINGYRVTIADKIREALEIHEGDYVSVSVRVYMRKEETLR